MACAAPDFGPVLVPPLRKNTDDHAASLATSRSARAGSTPPPGSRIFIGCCALTIAGPRSPGSGSPHTGGPGFTAEEYPHSPSATDPGFRRVRRDRRCTARWRDCAGACPTAATTECRRAPAAARKPARRASTLRFRRETGRGKRARPRIRVRPSRPRLALHRWMCSCSVPPRGARTDTIGAVDAHQLRLFAGQPQHGRTEQVHHVVRRAEAVVPVAQRPAAWFRSRCSRQTRG